MEKSRLSVRAGSLKERPCVGPYHDRDLRYNTRPLNTTAAIPPTGIATTPENPDNYAQPAIVSLPNSPVVGPIDSDSKKPRRSTLLSSMGLQRQMMIRTDLVP
ncbi:hypothetical protein BGX26_006036 [Mortierella sp. AD094]|nr:hypothetical protein BGX26_006036 [Mortierella sp. AD094]